MRARGIRRRQEEPLACAAVRRPHPICVDPVWLTCRPFPAVLLLHSLPSSTMSTFQYMDPAFACSFASLVRLTWLQ